MFHIRALLHIRPFSTVVEASEAATDASIVGTRLDYCNSLLFGTTEITSTA